MSGRLVCVGVGMKLGAHISPSSRNHIEQADFVFSLMSNGIVEKWVESMNNNVVSLQPFYNEGKNRNTTYNEMVEQIISKVRLGKKVVVAFYGHPGVFACVSHRSISLATKENHVAFMEPGISAEDCLYADLNIDPGKFGCAHYEASQFMLYERVVDPTAYLVLWQVGVAGDKSLSKISTGVEYKQVLVDILLEQYPEDHPVILYQAKVLPIDTVRKDQVLLKNLASESMTMETTLVIPPCLPMKIDNETRSKLKKLEQKDRKNIIKNNLVVVK